MAPENNWLSFSLSSMEMLSSSSSSQQPQMMQQSAMKVAPFEASPTDDSHHYYYSDANFYGWNNSRIQEVTPESNMNSHDHQSSMFFMDQNHPPPKLEDFLGGDSTETQDSSLTHIYDHHANSAAYFTNNKENHQDFKSLTGFPAFSTNSGSEVDDSASVGRTQVVCGGGGEFNGHDSFESTRNELVYAHCGTNGGLSLGVTAIPAATATTTTTTTTGTTNNSQNGVEKAIVGVDSEGCKKISDTFGQRTSIYRGVTRHRWTGRYEAHLWDNSCRREGQARKGRQVYLGGYDKEDKAARSYDLAALKYWGSTATTNFPVSNYTKEIEDMKHVTKQEFIASLRRKSSGFSRGASIYRGVTRHHQQGRWQARIGRVAGNKDLYLGTFATEEEAAEAYDIAAIKFRGINAVTNFEMNRYDVEAIMKSSLPIGGAAKRLKVALDSDQKPCLTNDLHNTDCTTNGSTSTISFSAIQPVTTSIPCGIPFDGTAPPYYHHNLFNHYPSVGAPDASGAMSTTTMPFMQQPAEFFIWPHQSYRL